LTQLAKIAQTFVVKGNWDSWYFTDLDRFGGTGATELTEKAVKVRVKDKDVWIGGLPVGSKNSVETVMRGVPLGDYRIFLFHYPDFIEQMQAGKIDLYLAGHTHGGQVALPLYGALVTLSARGKQFESGLHKLGDTCEYTNRGIGMEGGMAPRVRFCARPEVTVFTISGD
jgi:predicted MPP superfamily phosphohydrolase